MKPGERVESAFWLQGDETQPQLEALVTHCLDQLKRMQTQHNVEISPMQWSEKRPGEDRVPPVPAHISGPNVRLLYGEAFVVRSLPIIVPQTGFVHDLDRFDVARLRQITRNAHRKAFPKRSVLTDAECDEVIERVGPESALKTLRASVDSGMVH